LPRCPAASKLLASRLKPWVRRSRVLLASRYLRPHSGNWILWCSARRILAAVVFAQSSISAAVTQVGHLIRLRVAENSGSSMAVAYQLLLCKSRTKQELPEEDHVGPQSLQNRPKSTPERRQSPKIRQSLKATHKHLRALFNLQVSDF
jgi:hypothetical protein